MAFRIVSKRITWFQFPVVSIGSFLLCAVILLLPVDQGRPQNTDVSFKSNSVKTISQLGPDKRKVFAKLYDRGARAIMQQNAKEALEAFQQAATVWPEYPGSLPVRCPIPKPILMARSSTALSEDIAAGFGICRSLPGSSTCVYSCSS